MSYIIKDFKYKKGEKIKLKLNSSYNFYFNNDEICIKLYDEELITSYITTKYYKNFKNIVKLLLTLFESDDNDDDDINLVLDEISRLETLILNEYKNYLSADRVKKMLKEIFILKEELKNKMIVSYQIKAK